VLATYADVQAQRRGVEDIEDEELLVLILRVAQAAQRAVEKWKWAPAAHESTEAIELRFNPD